MTSDDELRDYMARIRRMARKAYPPHLREEAEDAGHLTLATCLREHDDARGEFWPWACTRIRWGMIDAVRKWTRRAHDGEVPELPRSLDEECGEDGQTLADLTACRLLDVDSSIDLRNALHDADPRQVKALLHFALLGEALSEVGEREGVSESRACQLVSGARAKVRARMSA